MVALSVVIPAHNAAKTLAETLDSLLAQSRSDWQAIIVDDGATDATREIAAGYVARDHRFHLLSDGRPCEGVSAARATESSWTMRPRAVSSIRRSPNDSGLSPLRR